MVKTYATRIDSIVLNLSTTLFSHLNQLDAVAETESGQWIAFTLTNTGRRAAIYQLRFTGQTLRLDELAPHAILNTLLEK